MTGASVLMTLKVDEGPGPLEPSQAGVALHAGPTAQDAGR